MIRNLYHSSQKKKKTFSFRNFEACKRNLGYMCR